MAKTEKQPVSVSAKPHRALQKQVPSGPLVQLDPNPVPKIKQVGGGNDDRWNSRVANHLIGSLPGAHSAKGIDEIANATLAGLVQINPNDPIEGMLAAQMISAHESALNLRRVAWHPEKSFVVRTKFLELAEKTTRSLAMLVDALDRHRGKGQQTVVVKHVTVNAEQAVVADQVVTQKLPQGEGPSRNERQPYAPACSTIVRRPPLPCQVKTDGPSLSCARRSRLSCLPDAWSSGRCANRRAKWELSARWPHEIYNKRGPVRQRSSSHSAGFKFMRLNATATFKMRPKYWVLAGTGHSQIQIRPPA